jgi:hypothetical protein
MRFRWLAIFPLLYAGIFIAIALGLGSGEALNDFVVWQRILVRVLGLAGCLAAVRGFERGDHLRRAWLSLGVGTALILLRDVLRLFPAFAPGSAGPGAQMILTGLGVLANFGLLGGVWLLARSWKMAAIALPGGRSGAVGVTLISALLALAVAGPGALASARNLAAGDWSALVLLVSAVVDILSLCLIAPLLLTAVSLRGGLFSWPWGLITASQLSWLCYDAAASLVPWADVFRGLAENYLFAAGLAQLFVIRQVRRLAAPAGKSLTRAPAPWP